MINEKIYSTVEYLDSNELKLFDCRTSNDTRFLSEFPRISKVNLTHNMMLDFVLTAYNYAKLAFKEYSSCYSRKTYTQQQLFAVIAYKTYNKCNYRTAIENLKTNTTLQKALGLESIPHFTTICKFFKRMSTKHIRDIDRILLSLFPVKNCCFSMDGTGYTNSYSDIYYNHETNQTERQFIKNHITIDSEYMLIRHHNALKGRRHDTIFAISAIRAIRKYKPLFILADRAYDTEPIKRTIMEETTALPQIPVKKRQKHGTYRTLSKYIFDPEIYRFRNQVECVNSIQKKIFSGINISRSTTLQIKETKLKNVFYNIYRSIQIIQERIST